MTTQAPLSPKQWISKGAAPSPSDLQAQNRSVRPSHDVAAESPQAESKIPKTTSSRLKTLFRRSNSTSSQAILVQQQQQQRQQLDGEARAGAGESRIARPGTAGGGGAGAGGVGRSASGKVFGGRRS